MIGEAFTTAPDKARQANQCERILSLLEQGPISRTSLVSVARNVTARISQLRNDGYTIDCIRQKGDNETVYVLR